MLNLDLIFVSRLFYNHRHKTMAVTETIGCDVNAAAFSRQMIFQNVNWFAVVSLIRVTFFCIPGKAFLAPQALF